MLKVQNLKQGMLKTVLFMLFLVSSTMAFAQNKVSGVVTDANGEPLIGVTVMEVGTQNGSVTDIDGRFALNVAQGKQLQFSYVGYTTKNVTVSGSTMNVTLAEDNALLEEVVVVGYGTMRRKDVTSSITTVKAEDLNRGVFTDPGQMLQGKVPGLVVSSTADPNGGPTITLLPTTSSLSTCSAMLQLQPSMVRKLPMV